jgi:hypothetical protein
MKRGLHWSITLTGRQLPKPLEAPLEPESQEQKQKQKSNLLHFFRSQGNEHLYKARRQVKTGIRVSWSEERQEEQLMCPFFKSVRSQKT